VSVTNRISRFSILLLLCLIYFGATGSAFAANAQQEGAASQASPAATGGNSEALYTDRGATTCMQCHSQAPVTDILQTPHGMKGDARTPFGQHECESCHGPSEAHAAGFAAGKPASPAVVFVGPNASSVAARNQVCLSCHQNGERMDWVGSQHQDHNLACVSCHTIHVTKDPILVKATQPQKCFSCHAEQRSLTLQYSHHPIREGKVVCADCHNPHGSAGPNMLRKVRVTDLCYTCHADKRGPMLWEHQPVREDCTNCHNPHGSVNPRLLKEKVPFLCIGCHAATNDMGGEGVSHAGLGGGSQFYLMGDRSCLNCHSQIHGSNSPSGSTFFR
jgi:DmsE family decaheme c-type cytochrome